MSKGLDWFPFYVDKWLGGTLAFTSAEETAYLRILLAQWKSGSDKCVTDSPNVLGKICNEKDFTPAVRRKFKQIKIDGVLYLRNLTLAGIWDKQNDRHNAAVTGGKARGKQLAGKPALNTARKTAKKTASKTASRQPSYTSPYGEGDAPAAATLDAPPAGAGNGVDRDDSFVPATSEEASAVLAEVARRKAALKPDPEPEDLCKEIFG